MTTASETGSQKSWPDGAGLLQKAEALAPFLREQATAVEDGRQLTAEVHQALLGTGFYRMTTPLQAGAPEVTIPEMMRILEALARGDGSAAWSVWAGLGAPTTAAFMLEEGVAQIFEPADAYTVASLAAVGRAVAVEAGYRVTGRWPFNSGVNLAAYTGGLCAVFDGEAPRLTADGEPMVIFAMWPVSQCQIIDTWDTTGLRGTGSNDITADDLFVPATAVADFSRPPRPGLTPIHYMDVDNAANITVAAIALGIASAAVEAFRQLGPQKKMVNGEILAESSLGKTALAQAGMELDQARGHLYEIAEMMSDELLDGSYQNERWHDPTALTSTAAADAAINAALRVYRAAGTSAIFRSRLFDRCLRDLLTLGAHKTVAPLNVLTHGGSAFAGVIG